MAPPPRGLGCTTSEFDHFLLLVDLGPRSAPTAGSDPVVVCPAPGGPPVRTATQAVRYKRKDGTGKEIAPDASPVRWTRQRRTSNADLALNSQERAVTNPYGAS